MSASLATLNPSFPAYFRLRKVGERVLLTNQEGSWIQLSQQDFDKFSQGEIEEGSELWNELSERNFIRSTYSMDKAVERVARRKRFLGSGPNLHAFVVTLRCNETCVYCHASRANMDQVETDMTPEIAEKSVDLALQSTSRFITIEFQGGEPLVNFPVVQHTIEYAQKRAAELGKVIEFTMVSNMALMSEEKLDYLLEKRVQMCTSIDGPQHLHDRQRKLPGLSAYNAATTWIARINERYREMGLDSTLYHVEALLTTTREALKYPKEIVDVYASLGCKALFLRPVDPFGFMERVGHRVEYPREEYLKFYREATDYIIELNKQGVQILERYAAIFLTKILQGEDPNFLDIRSPSGQGIGQLAYSYDGNIYTCDEGRMLAATGDDALLVGNVFTSSYREILGHPTVRTMVMASNLEAQPDCVNCTYVPYCGVPPAHTYKTQGTVFGKMRQSTICAVHKGIQDYLFEKLDKADEETLKILERWTTIRPRDHFVQLPEGEASGE